MYIYLYMVEYRYKVELGIDPDNPWNDSDAERPQNFLKKKKKKMIIHIDPSFYKAKIKRSVKELCFIL